MASSANEYAAWDAVETAERIRKRDVSAREVVEAAIARAADQAHLGAVVTATFDGALAAADRATGPLAGVPTFIKDLTQVAGVRTTWGSNAAGHYVSKKTDPLAERLERAGLVSLGKSATPELGLTATTEPLGQPPCRNPYDNERSSGGSSGGAAALVAAGVVPIAHASDGGGSIRIPSSCCGLVGLKPTRGRFDMEASNLLPINIASHGVVARTVRDVAAFFEAVEPLGPRRVAPIGPLAPALSRRLRIGVFVEPPLRTTVHPDHQRAALEAGKRCEALGHHVEQIPCPFEGWFSTDFFRYWGFIAFVEVKGAKLLIHPGVDPSKFEPWTKGIAEYFWKDTRAGARAIARLLGFGRIYARVMERFDVLVCPTLAEPPPRLGWLSTDVPFETGYERLLAYAPFCAPQNVAGAPAVSLPMGVGEGGLPVGVQFGGRVGEDGLLLALASQIEASSGFAAYGG